MGRDSVVIELEDLCFAYPRRGPVIQGLSLRLLKGEKLGLEGPNGSGKTTLFHIIMGLLRPSSGSVRVFGKRAETEQDFRSVRRKVGLLFQDPDDQLFSPTVLEDVAFGPLNLGRSAADAKETARKCLALVGLEGFEDRLTHELSGGEKRLVSLVTVLAMEPRVLLLDEPTNGLDEITRAKIMEVLNRLGVSSITVSHDRAFLENTTHRLMALEQGRIVPAREHTCCRVIG